MDKPNIFYLSRPKTFIDYLYIFLSLLVVAVALRFILVYALPYYGLTEDSMGRFWDYKISLVGHVSGGIIALLIGPFQFWKAFRNNYFKIHRWLGRIYLISIVIGGLCATYLAWTSGLAIDINWALGLQGLAIAWLLTTFMAYFSIRHGRTEQHRVWMIKSYVVTFAFITFRILSDYPFEDQFGVSITGSSFLWMSWSIPLLVTEAIIRWNNK